jgi:peptide/nickel transport system permease protein
VRTQRFVAGKILQAVLTLFFILTFNFFLFRILPGDPVAVLTKTQGLELSGEQQEELREDLGLLDPLPKQ